MSSVQVHRVDSRGNRWLKTTVSDQIIDDMNEVLDRWMTVEQEQCDATKLKAFQLFWPSMRNHLFLKGMCSKDFFYAYKDMPGDTHVFVCTKGQHKGSAMCYEGECDMHFASHADWNLIMVQADCM